MTYTPTEWKNGDTITAEKLNNMEQGIADAGSGSSGAFIVGFSFDFGTHTITCDKTAQEIAQAIANGAMVLLADARLEDSYCMMVQVVRFEYDNYDPESFNGSMVTIGAGGSAIVWTIDSASSYPYTEAQI